jgi:hypothetical protein
VRRRRVQTGQQPPCESSRCCCCARVCSAGRGCSCERRCGGGGGKALVGLLLLLAAEVMVRQLDWSMPWSPDVML